MHARHADPGHRRKQDVRGSARLRDHPVLAYRGRIGAQVARARLQGSVDNRVARSTGAVRQALLRGAMQVAVARVVNSPAQPISSYSSISATVLDDGPPTSTGMCRGAAE